MHAHKEIESRVVLELIKLLRCKSDGTCACFDGWGGAHCDKPATGGAQECYMDADCEAGHVCDGGMCFCVGEECGTCACGEFGAGQTCGAAKTCSIDTTCSSHGRYLMCVYIYIYIYAYIYMYIYIYVYIYWFHSCHAIRRCI